MAKEIAEVNAQISSSGTSSSNSAMSSSTADNEPIDVEMLSTNSNVNKSTRVNNDGAMDVENETNVNSQKSKVSDDNSKSGNTSEKQNQGDEKKEAEIINLDDDDDDEDEVCSNTCEVYERKDRNYNNNCMNPDCTSGVDLAPPAMFVLTYFGMKKCRDQFICAECFNEVVKQQEKLADLLENNEPLIKSDFPVNNSVILLDSDEEDVPDEGGVLPQEVLAVVEKHLEDAMNNSLNHYDIDYQIEASQEFLDSKITVLEASSKELMDTFDRLQRELDSMRKQVYDVYRHPIRELEELHISQCEIPSMSPSQRQMRDTVVSRRSESNRVDSSHASSSDYMGQDVVALDQERTRPPANLPPIGPILRPKLKVDDLVYVMRVSFYSTWVMARIIEIIPNKSKNDISDITKPLEMYRVRVESPQHRKTILVKNVVGRYLALPDPSPVRLPVGTRIIAAFKDEGKPFSKDNFYSGIVAEPPKSMNKFRYLIFFDDGYAQYVPHENVRLVCESSKHVWEDIHPESREFIKTYLQQYPERPMVRLQEGQIVKTEWNGRWWTARVLEVDGSLVKVHFDADSRTEWIYRGSTRLLPLFNEIAAAKERQQSGSLMRGRGFGAASMKQYNMPYVEYTRQDPEDKRPGEYTDDEVTEVVPTRSVARKSTAKRAAEATSTPVVVNANIPKPLKEPSEGKIEEKKLVNPLKPMKFKPHRCSKACVAWTKYTPERAKGISLLAVPLNFGFQRLLCRYRGKRTVMYIAPCGMRIRRLDEMLDYLRATNSLLTIDMFDFDFWVNCTAEFQLDKTFLHIEDLSYGKEKVPISCVNDLDHHNPIYVEYMTERQPAEGVNLNLDKNFLSACDCEDDCSDRTKCACWKLTMEGAVFAGAESDLVYGYQYRRLPERVITGIYECNSQCKCKSTCLNRVVQQPLSQKLQLFKTALKGWGIRCLNDIPRGSFICIYAGFLLTEQAANEGGKNYGDEYLAELDYIEVVERVKEDYEDHPPREAMAFIEQSRAAEKKREEDKSKEKSKEGNDDESSGESSSTCSRRGEVDEEIEIGWQNLLNGSHGNSVRSRLRKRRSNAMTEFYDEDDEDNDDDDDEDMDVDEDDGRVRKPSRFMATVGEEEEYTPRYPSVRDLFGPDESVYIMDAKTNGNIGRYLNHSCTPNVFVQNVFVDTHDLRFPWVAFFASTYIRAGTELTWDYNYDVGSVPGKVLHCYCGSSNCRGRLL